MDAVAGRISHQRLQHGVGQAEQRLPLIVLDFAVQSRRHLAELTVDGGIAAELRALADERAERPHVRFFGSVGERDVALVFGQRAIALELEVDRRSPVAVDHQPRRLSLSAEIAALGRYSRFGLGGGRAEALAKDEVHHLLVGAIAVFERHFLRQDLDPFDRFGGNVAKLAEARDALAVEEHHRPLAAAAARASELRLERFEQFGDVVGVRRANVARVEHILRRDIADDRASPGPGDDDRLAIGLFKEVLGGRIARRIAGRRFFLRLSFLRERRGGQERGKSSSGCESQATRYCACTVHPPPLQ